jgi:hypothetical protein
MKEDGMSQSRQRWIAAFLFVAAALSPHGADAQDATVDLNSRGEVAGHATFT